MRTTREVYLQFSQTAISINKQSGRMSSIIPSNACYKFQLKFRLYYPHSVGYKYCLHISLKVEDLLNRTKNRDIHFKGPLLSSSSSLSHCLKYQCYFGNSCHIVQPSFSTTFRYFLPHMETKWNN